MSRDSENVLGCLGILRMSRDSENAQRNLEIAEILRLHGTYIKIYMYMYNTKDATVLMLVYGFCS